MFEKHKYPLPQHRPYYALITNLTHFTHNTLEHINKSQTCLTLDDRDSLTRYVSPSSLDPFDYDSTLLTDYPLDLIYSDSFSISQASSAVKPDSQKGVGEKAKETLDNAAATLQPDSTKSNTQKAGDKLSGSDKSDESILDKAKNAVGLGN